jgi:1-acyl-sn-glycerol-3-phosphate acyltransferase
MIRFLCLNAFIAIHTIILSLWGLLVSLFDREGGRLLHRYVAVPWARVILLVCGVRLEVMGGENMGMGSPHIYMSNHQSYFDIFALLAGLPGDFKFLLKQELMKIPLFGMAMRKAGYISIDRRDFRKAAKSIKEAAEKIRKGASVLIFPEGTRSEDGHVQAFKKGGFHLALRSGCDIVPVALINSRSIVPKGSLRVNRGIITIIIGKAIPVQDYSKRDIDGLVERTRTAIVRQMTEVKGIGA